MPGAKQKLDPKGKWTHGDPRTASPRAHGTPGIGKPGGPGLPGQPGAKGERGPKGPPRALQAFRSLKERRAWDARPARPEGSSRDAWPPTL